MKKHFVYALAAASFLAVGCEEVEEAPFAGPLELGKYISVGNSLTAGYTNGEVYLSAQGHSYPAIIAEQFALVGGGAFKQPLMANDVGFGQRRYLDSIRTVNGATTTYITQHDVADMQSIGANMARISGPFNNLGVPGARSFHLPFAGYGHATLGNPYYSRWATDPNNSSILSELPGDHTFFTLWIGNNDVLGYATSGADDALDSITPQAIFDASLEATVAALMSSSATDKVRGAIANIPDVTTIPYFTTVPYNALPLDTAKAAALDYAYDLTEAGLAQMGIVHDYDDKFHVGANAFMIQVEGLLSDDGKPLPAPYNVRPATAGDKITLTLPTSLVATAGMGSFDAANSVPYGIPDRYVLTPDEAQRIKTATDNFNAKLAALAQANDLAYVDMNAFMTQLFTTGFSHSGVSYTAAYITGSAFSLDGVHPTSMGYALLASLFIDEINAKYGSRIPRPWSAGRPTF